MPSLSNIENELKIINVHCNFKSEIYNQIITLLGYNHQLKIGKIANVQLTSYCMQNKVYITVNCCIRLDKFFRILSRLH